LNGAARAWLDALGLEPRLPDVRFLEDLFHVFQRRVAYETLTRAAGNPAAFDAEAFAAEWAEEERGLTGEERARAFAWLASEIGFDVALEESLCSRPWTTPEPGVERLGAGAGGFSSKVNGPEAHRSVIATIEGRRILADAALPLPVLVPLDMPPMEIPTGFGTLSAVDGPSVTCDARGEVAELLRLLLAPHPNPFPLEELRRPSPDASPTPFALRVLDDRVLHWAGGVMTILDAWSVLTYPLAGAERAAFESLFALNLDGVELPAVPASDIVPVLTVFHTAPLSPEEVRRGLERAERPASDLIAPPEAVIEAIPGGSRIARSARFLARVPAAGPGESVRRTLVFHLAMDLLRLGENGAAG
jgi:hypothetical protein